MNIDSHFAGIVILILVIVIVQIVIFVRIVLSIKSHIQRLKRARDEAMLAGQNSAHFEKAYSMLDRIQREKLVAMRGTLLGKILSYIFAGTSYEKTSR